MDIAVLNYFEDTERQAPYQEVIKVDEIPFDFSRRRLTVVVKADGHQIMVTKVLLREMEKVCKYVEVNGQVLELTDELREKLREVNHPA